MASLSDVTQFRDALAAISQLAVDQLDDFIASIDLAGGVVTRDALLAFVPALTTRYGEAAALLGAEYYDALRAAAGAPGVFLAPLADTVPVEQVQKRVRFGAAHLFTDTPELIVPFLAGAVDKYVKAPARETVIGAAGADPARPRWARVPTGTTTCAWCIVMASRGWVYTSKTSAGGGSKKFHDNCDCAVVVSFDRTPHLDGYDPDHYRELYSAAVKEAGTRRLAGRGNVVSTLQKML
jgi:hypothetical protein